MSIPVGRLAPVRKEIIDLFNQDFGTFQFALPDDQAFPTGCCQLPHISPISPSVALNLVAPKTDSALWKPAISASRVTMPKAAVHKNYLSKSRKDKIGLPRQGRKVQTVAKAHSEYDPPHCKFRSGVTSLNSTHEPAASQASKAVHASSSGTAGKSPPKSSNGSVLMAYAYATAAFQARKRVTSPQPQTNSRSQ